MIRYIDTTTREMRIKYCDLLLNFYELGFTEGTGAKSFETFQLLSDKHEVCYMADQIMSGAAFKVQISKQPLSCHAEGSTTIHQYLRIR